MLNEIVMNVLDSVNAIVENAGGNRLVVFNQATAVRLSKCSFTTLRKFLKVVKTEKTYTIWKRTENLDDDDKEYIMKKIRKGTWTTHDVEERYGVTIIEGKRNWYQIDWEKVISYYNIAVVRTQDDLEKVIRTQGDLEKLLSYDSMKGLV